MRFVKDGALQERIGEIVESLSFTHINPTQIVTFRSFGSKARAMARIWSFPKIWQLALSTQPHYCIEVLSEKFDRLSEDEKTKVLIHELLHIPKNFSGALLPHRHRGGNIDRKVIESYFRKIRS
ncbi:metallopeptidase [Patescibacteria group bacterium]|nr:metallopeptidase [Patescibacteria group bacterium]